MSHEIRVVHTVTAIPFIFELLLVDGEERYRLSGDPKRFSPWSRPNYSAILNMVITKYHQLARLFPGQPDESRLKSAIQIVTSQLTESGQLVLTEHGYNFTQLPSKPWTA